MGSLPIRENNIKYVVLFIYLFIYYYIFISHALVSRQTYFGHEKIGNMASISLTLVKILCSPIKNGVLSPLSTFPSLGIACRMAEINAAFCLVTRTSENIKNIWNINFFYILSFISQNLKLKTRQGRKRRYLFATSTCSTTHAPPTWTVYKF